VDERGRLLPQAVIHPASKEGDQGVKPAGVEIPARLAGSGDGQRSSPILRKHHVLGGRGLTSPETNRLKGRYVDKYSVRTYSTVTQQQINNISVNSL